LTHTLRSASTELPGTDKLQVRKASETDRD